jgi:hypothetical protein
MWVAIITFPPFAGFSFMGEVGKKQIINLGYEKYCCRATCSSWVELLQQVPMKGLAYKGRTKG